MSEFVVEDRSGVRRVPIGRRMTIGRSPSNDLALNAMFASRRHAWVWRQGDRVIIEDLTSTNGTYVNGQRLTHARFLKHNDVITIGDGQLTYVEGWNLATGLTPPRGLPRPGAGPVYCGTCGAANPPQARVCSRCGRALDVGARPGGDWGSGGGRPSGSFTPTDPIVARPFPVSESLPAERSGSGAWILILVLAILAVAFLTVMALLVLYTLS
jgi:hypothetical protein